MYEFTYRKPTSIEDAVTQLSKSEDGRPLAGGMSLIPTLRFRLSSASDLIDLNGLGQLSGINQHDGTLTIGAMTRHATVATSEEVQNSIPALALLAGSIGVVQVRNRGTIGGSICFADPAADYPAGLLGLGATINTVGRSIASDEFFTGLYETALDEGELVQSVDFPIPERAGWAKFGNQASRFAIVAVMVSLLRGNVRVAVTGAKPQVFRLAEMEDALSSNFSSEALEGITLPADDLNEDLHADKEYRAHLVTIMARRAVDAAVAS